MADPLKIGRRTITFDFSKVTHREYVYFWSDTGQKDEEFKTAFFEKVCGMTSDQIEDLPEPDWRRFRDAFRLACLEPTEEAAKNSQSASTSQA